MERSFLNVRFISHLLLSCPLVLGPAAYAATAINLSHAPITTIQTLLDAKAIGAQSITVEETTRALDVKKNLHVRAQQKYLGYTVRGADFVIHIPHATQSKMNLQQILKKAPAPLFMTGTIYTGLDQDLKKTQANTNEASAKHALKRAIDLAVNQYKIHDQPKIEEVKTEVMVTIDKKQTAHWAFKVTFLVPPVSEDQIPIKPVYLLDAATGEVYANWNDIKNIKEVVLGDTYGGGFGGNKKMGKLTYDGLPSDLPKLTVSFNEQNKTCYWANSDVTVKSYQNKTKMSFACKQVDPNHNNVYWIGDKDSINGGYGPSSDALFAGAVIKDMYQNWYHIPVLVNDDGSPMMLNMVVHVPRYDNAYWDGRQMTFGDGYTYFYPLTSLGVGAHEISHGFTEQHSGLEYYAQSGGMNEAFSDMAAQAAEFYAYEKNSWQIGPEIFKAENEALRYMDQPSKDCPPGNQPGEWCSIDDASQYPSDNSLDVHYSSGVYNRLFYLMGTSAGWDTRKAFDVMVHANQHYWGYTTDFSEGACGIIHSAQDLGYDVDVVKAALDKVKIDFSMC